MGSTADPEVTLSQSPSGPLTDSWEASPRLVLKLGALRDLVRRYGLWILAGAALVAGLAVILGRMLLFTYSATALIMVDPRNVRLPQGQDVLPGYGSDPFAVESMVQLAKSDAFYNSVLDAMGAASETGFDSADRRASLDRLKRVLTVTRRGATYLIEVTATSPDASQAERLANRAAQTIVDEQLRLRSASTQTALKWLDARTAELKTKLRQSEDAAAAMKADMRLTDAGSGYTLQERKLADLNQQLALANAQTAEARARRDRLRAPNVSLPQEAAPPLLLSLQQELARAERTLADRLTALGERHPEVVALRSQIVAFKAQVTSEEKALRAQAEAKLAEAQSRERALSTQLSQEQDRSGLQTKSAVSLAELEREARSDRAVFEQLLTRRKELEDSKNLELPDVRIAARAIAPLRGSGPSLAVLAFVGLVMGGLSATGLCVLHDANPGRWSTLRARQNTGPKERKGSQDPTGPQNGKDPQERKGMRNRKGLRGAPSSPQGSPTPWRVKAHRRTIEIPFVAINSPLASTPVRDLAFHVAIGQLAAALEGHDVIYVGSSQEEAGRSALASHLADELVTRGHTVLVIESASPSWSPKPSRPPGLARGRHRGLRAHPFSTAAVLPASAWLDQDWRDPLRIGPREIADLVNASRRCFDRIVIDGREASSAMAGWLAAAADQCVDIIDPREPLPFPDDHTVYVTNKVPRS